MNRIGMALVAAGISAPLDLSASLFPAIANQDWTVNHINEGISGAWIPVEDGPGNVSLKQVFASIYFTGININNTVFTATTDKLVGSPWNQVISCSDGSLGKRYLTKWNFDGSEVDINFDFCRSGRYEMGARLIYHPLGFTGNYMEAYFYLDYDLNGAGNDVYEFVWNPSSTGGLKPTQGVANLTRSNTPAGTNEFWTTVANEVKISYPGWLSIVQANAVEKIALVRVRDAGATGTQFGTVLWQTAQSSDFTFKAYGGSVLGAPPAPNPSLSIQSTADDPSATARYPRYAYSGSDQLVYVAAKYDNVWPAGPNWPGTWNGFAGKVIQKPGLRPLTWNARSHQGITQFNWDVNIRTVNGTARTPRLVLTELLGGTVEGDNLRTRRSGTGADDLPWMVAPGTNGFPSAGGNITRAQLHNLLVNGHREHTTAQLEKVSHWTIDTFLMNWRDASNPSGTLGIMFDHPGSNINRVGRQAAAIYWPTHSTFGTSGGPTGQQKEAALTLLHEGGHALNFGHAHSSCHGVTGGPCTANPPVPPSIMSYYTHNDGTRPNAVYFNNENPSSSNGNKDRNLRRFYQTAPEAWAKPGLNSSPAWLPHSSSDVPNSIPTYFTY